VTPRVARNTTDRRLAIDGRTIITPGYAVSEHIRKLIEEVFGWAKTAADCTRPATVKGIASAECHPNSQRYGEADDGVVAPVIRQKKADYDKASR
jgi:hypothetical protein